MRLRRWALRFAVTGATLRCEVFFDRIHRLHAVQNTRQLFLERYRPYPRPTCTLVAHSVCVRVRVRVPNSQPRFCEASAVCIFVRPGYRPPRNSKGVCLIFESTDVANHSLLVNNEPAPSSIKSMSSLCQGGWRDITSKTVRVGTTLRSSVVTVFRYIPHPSGMERQSGPIPKQTSYQAYHWKSLARAISPRICSWQLGNCSGVTSCETPVPHFGNEHAEGCWDDHVGQPS